CGGAAIIACGGTETGGSGSPQRNDPAGAGSRDDPGTAVAALLAHPHLLPADEGDAAGHAQLAAAFEHLDLGLVGLALGGVEHGAAAPLVAVRLQAPQDGHALDRLV